MARMVPESNQRPDPDALLARIQSEERQKHRGKLKIFLGYAAGVGKTSKMLKEAHLRKNDGVDVKVGYVETHGRKETDALLEGLTVIPRKMVEYRGTTIPEMDLDAVLAARPQLVLVDELAHTNAPGSRHPKRYQDVEELLDAGIDVYTTLNIQHLESLNDVVAQITGIVVRETIPDKVIDRATEIEVVDLPPPELLQRLLEGKVYVPDLAARAIQRFFNEGNLYALRELALRRTAERVDDQMLEYMRTRGIPGPWAAGEHLLVCLGPSPLSEQLVRIARRQADRLNADWTAIYVRTPSHHRLPKKSKEQVRQALQLAERLGGKIVTVFGLNIPNTVIDYARKHNITRIIVGKTLSPWWKRILLGSVVDQMIDESGAIDIYVVSGQEKTLQKSAAMEPLLPAAPPGGYLSSLLLVTVITIFGELVRSFISSTNLMTLYILAVVVAAYRWGLGPAIFTATAGVLAFDFFFVPPQLTFRVSDTQYLITFIGMIVVGSVISLLVARAREHAEAAMNRERETGTLYGLSQNLVIAGSLNAVIAAVIRHIEETFQWESVFLLPENDKLVQRGASPGLTLDENEIAVATWAYKHGVIAGYDTDTLPGSRLRYIPLRSSRGVIGIIGVKPKDPEGDITPEQARMLEAFASQAALSMERVNMAESTRGSG